MSDLNVPEPLLDALLCVANEYMSETEFDMVINTDWSNRQKAGPAWKQINLCLQKVYNSPFPGPREMMANLEIVLAQYQLKFDGTLIIRNDSRRN